MKNKEYRNAKLKYKLLEKKQNGTKEVIWKINTSQREFIERTLGFYTEPYLYEVQTRRFHNVFNLEEILKDVHYKNKQGKKTVVFRLSPEEMRVLDEYAVKYRPYKFRIVLN